jgi:serine/threonine-protein kinase
MRKALEQASVSVTVSQPVSGVQRIPLGPDLQPQTPFANDSVLDGRYRLRRTIGQGGMCVVFEAQHVFTGKMVAIKTLLPELRHSSEARERILREGQVLGALRHSSIVSIEDAGIASNGVPYLVLEKLEGRGLDSILDLRRRLPVADALHVAACVARAVAEAHRAGFVHRDIKPSNVVIVHGSDALGGEEIRLLDFGVAVASEDGGDRPKLTAAGMMVGTPEYLAPEQLLGAPATVLTDIYALGVLLFECLTGELPFPGQFGQRLVKVVTTDAPSVKTFRDDVSDGVAALVGKALAREAQARFPSAASFARAIEELGESADVLRLLRGVPPPLPAAATRQHARAAYASPLRLEVGSREIEAASADLSIGGMLCMVSEHVEVGTHLTIRMTSPIGGAPVDVQGLVRWTRKADRSSRFAFATGIEFMSVSSSLRREIEEYVSRLAAPR